MIRPRVLSCPALLATVLTCAAGFVLGGCSEDLDGRNSGPVDRQRTADEAAADYQRFNDDLTARLDEALGPRAWESVEDSGGRAFCGDDSAGIKVNLPRLRFDGGYDDAQRDTLQEVLTKVGAEHGFDAPVIGEKPDHLQMAARGSDGASYTLVVSNRTVLSTSTGCHGPG